MAAAAQTLDPDVGAEPGYHPVGAAAGVRLAQAEDVTRLKSDQHLRDHIDGIIPPRRMV